MLPITSGTPGSVGFSYPPQTVFLHLEMHSNSRWRPIESLDPEESTTPEGTEVAALENVEALQRHKEVVPESVGPVDASEKSTGSSFFGGI